MKKRVFIALTLFGAISVALASMGEHFEREEMEEREESYYSKPISSKKSSENELYQKECGACHFAYQSELLPKRSWEKMMANLSDHFGTDATLAKEDEEAIKKYLVNNAGETAEYKYFIKINRSIARNEVPLRISETPYFIKEHREIPKRLITQKEVGSIANCNSCHKSADRGQYGERGINIPNYGKWDD